MENRTDWIDYAKGIAIILVVYGHVLVGINGSELEITEKFFKYSFDVIWSLHMPVFFFIAGLYVNKSLSNRGFIPFLTNKIKVLGYPYIVWSIIFGSLWIVLGNYTNTKNMSIYDILSIPYKPISIYWFLYVLLLMHSTFAIVSKFKINLPAILILISLGLVLFIPKFDEAIHEELRVINKFTFNFIYFSLGYIYNKYFIDSIINRNSSSINTIIVLCFFILFEYLVFFVKIIPPFRLTKVSLTIFGIMTVCFVSKYLAQKNWLKLIKIAGYYSMPIYLAHLLTASGTRIILDKFMGIQKPIILHIVIGTILGILFPILLYKFSMKIKFPYLFMFPKSTSSQSENKTEHA
ncbi:acyltransferase [Patescibacteria group bacterium]|nr:acyltransferase [Patescibacteria group bacterium]